MPFDSRDLNALLGSRICHDLISPLGAIGNGVELLSMAGISAAPEIALISESVENASARIRFFRIAFGAASQTQLMGREEIVRTITDMTKGSRMQIDWQPQVDVPRAEVKLAFLLLQCLESAMPWGGRITILKTEDRWHLLGAADKLKIEAGLWEVLANPMADVDVNSSNVHFALAPEAARRLDRPIIADLKPNAIAVEF